MAPTRVLRFVAAGFAALALSGGLSACTIIKKDEVGSADEPAREGLAINVAGVDYNVFTTRELNLKIPPDKAYYTGPAAPPGQVLYGVFIKACAVGERTRTTSDFKVTDNQGNVYRPKILPASNPFSYQPRPLSKKECIPQAGSVAQQGPTAAAMLLFQFPLLNTENRPLDMAISAVDPKTRKVETKHVDLDL